MTACQPHAMTYTHVLAPNRTGRRLKRVSKHPTYGLPTIETKTGVLPRSLKPVHPEPHSWEAMVENILNGNTAPVITGSEVTPRTYQSARIREIAEAYTKNVPGYYLNYPTGSGKTVIAIEAIKRIAVDEGRKLRVLVIAPLRALPTWQKTLNEVGTGNAEWAVINPDRLDTLVYDPRRRVLEDNTGYYSQDPVSRRAVAAERGRPHVTFDAVVMDEAHLAVNADALRSSIWRRIVGWGHGHLGGPKTFTLNMSATAFSDPEELSPALHLLAYNKGVPTPDEETIRTGLRTWLEAQVGLPIVYDSHRFRWSDNPGVSRRLSRLLFNGTTGHTETATDLGLPAQSRQLRLVSLNTRERRIYEASWTAFLENFPEASFHRARARTLAPGTENPFFEPSSELTKQLREVQRASIAKTRSVADIIEDLLNEGHQVIVPAWLEATANAIAQEIDGRFPGGDPVAVVVTGDVNGSAADRARAIRQFQSGLRRVIITTITESISLHASEKGGGIDGEDATSAPRTTVIADVLGGGKKAYQAEGRGTRDGKHANVIYCIAEDTREVPWSANVFDSLATTRALTLSGRVSPDSEEDIRSFTELARRLRETQEETRALGDAA